MKFTQFITNDFPATAIVVVWTEKHSYIDNVMIQGVFDDKGGSFKSQPSCSTTLMALF